MAVIEKEVEEIKKEVANLTSSLDEGWKNLQGELSVALKKRDEQIEKHGGSLTETTTLIKKLDDQFVAMKASLEERFVPLEKRINRVWGQAEDQEAVDATKSFVEVFTQSDAWKSFEAKGYSGSSENFKVPNPLRHERKAVGIPDAAISALRGIFSTQRLMELFNMPLRANRVRDLFQVINTTDDVVEFIREKIGAAGYTNNASPVAEGSLKQESGFDFEDASANMRTLAHWVPTTRQQARNLPALIQYLERRLIDGLKLVEDTQLLYGSGVAPNLNGILTDSDIQGYVQLATDNMIDAIRKGLTLVQMAYVAATGIVLHPLDWQDIQLAKDSQDRYLWLVVSQGTEEVMFRVPVVVTTAINQGTALTGDFSQGAFIYVNEEAVMRSTDSHSDFFLYNKLVWLVEECLLQIIPRPQAFVEITFLGS